MRAILAAGALVLFCPALALAQTPAPAAPATPKTAATTAPKRGGDITRDQYVERAKQNAEKRFDRMDANHDGVLTADERRAYRESHSRKRKTATQ